MPGRGQGTIRATLMIAALVVPVVVLGVLAYRRYTESRREYLTRLDYSELAIAADQLASRVNGWGRFSELVGSEPKAGGNSCTDRLSALIEDPSITCDPQGPKGDLGHRVGVEESDGGAFFYIPGARSLWGRVSVASVIADLQVDRQRFDDVLLMTNDGWVIHGDTARRVSLRDAIVPASEGAGRPADAPAGGGTNNGAGLHRFSGTRPADVRWHDTPHLLFVHPTGLRISFRAPGGTEAEDVELLLGGLVSRERFEAETQRIEYRWLLGAMLLLVLGLLSWPLLSLRLLGPRERLSAADVRVLAFALVGLAGLGPAVLLTVTASGAFEAEADSQLPEVATQLKDNFERRIQQALDVLAQVNVKEEAVSGAARSTFTPIRLSIVGSDGGVGKSWEVKSAEGPTDVQSVGLNVSDRAYFRAAQEGNAALWQRPDGTAYIAEVVRSKRQGIHKLIVAQPAPDRRVIIANSEIDAFKDPLLPPGFGFAILDETGKVELHSRSARNVVENFYDAVDDPSELKAAVAMGKTSAATAWYAGDEAFFRIEPLGDTSWTLLVFRAVGSVQTLVLETAARFAVLYVAYLALGLACFLLFEGVTGRYRFRWLWPDRSVPAVLYTVVAVRLTLLALLFWAAWADADARERVILLGAMPLLGLLAAARDLAQNREVTTRSEATVGIALGVAATIAVIWAGRWYGVLAAAASVVPARHLVAARRQLPARTETRFRAAYVACIIAVLTLVASMPATLLFEDAKSEVHREFLQTLQSTFGGDHPGESVYETSLTQGKPPVTSGSDFPIAGTFLAERLSAWIAQLLPVYSPTVAEMRQHRGVVPRLGGGPRTILLVVGALIAACLGVVTLLGVVTRLFHLDADPLNDDATLPPAATGAAAVFVYRIVGADVPADRARNALATIDLRAVRDPKGLEAWWSDSRTNHRRFELRHLESRLHDPKWQEAILAVLEEAVFDPTRAVVVTSAIEPFHYVRTRTSRGRSVGGGAPAEPEAAPDGLLSRWSLVLSALWKEHYDLPLRADRRIDDDVRQALAGHAAETSGVSEETMEGRYREVWRMLTRDERLVMRHLAEEGFVAPAAVQTVRLLMRRRLVRREPMLSITSEGIRRFVLRAEPPETIAEWEAGGRTGMDILARWLPAALVAGLVFVFATQREAFNATTTIVGAAGTALPLLFRVLGSAGSPQPGKEEAALV